MNRVAENNMYIAGLAANASKAASAYTTPFALSVDTRDVDAAECTAPRYKGMRWGERCKIGCMREQAGMGIGARKGVELGKRGWPILLGPLRHPSTTGLDSLDVSPSLWSLIPLQSPGSPSIFVHIGWYTDIHETEYEFYPRNTPPTYIIYDDKVLRPSVPSFEFNHCVHPPSERCHWYEESPSETDYRPGSSLGQGVRPTPWRPPGARTCQEKMGQSKIMRKEWPKQFREEQPYIRRAKTFRDEWQWMGEYDTKGLRLYLTDQVCDKNDLDAPRATFDALDFCEHSSYQAVEEGHNHAGCRRVAWAATQESHTHPDPRPLNPPSVKPSMTGCEFNKFFKDLRKDSVAKISRIYSQLDGYVLRVLAEHSTLDEAPDLQEAIFRQVSFQSAFRIKTSYNFRASFQLIMDLPHLMLRQSYREWPPKHAMTDRLSRDEYDVRFLDLQPRDHDGQGLREWKIYPTQFSLLVHGISEHQWTAFAFGDPLFDDFIGNIGNTIGDDENPVDNEFVDQISHGNMTPDQLVANPREYFAMILQYRVHLALRSWKFLTGEVQMEEHQVEHANARQISESLEWAKKAAEFPSKLLPILTKTMEEWVRFEKRGDLDFFDDLHGDESETARKVQASLHSVERDMEDFKRVEEILLGMERKCREYYAEWEKSERKLKDAQQSQFARIATKIYGPLQITGSIFGADKDALPLTPNKTNFFLVLLVFLVFAELYGVISDFLSAKATGAWDMAWNFHSRGKVDEQDKEGENAGPPRELDAVEQPTELSA
ncbi:hypothetical protein MKZ38_004611 [Zalerion maritima]|uniref:Uncharacterized protein n=1 Tax=Zalerion maritima TaxID=339359 RepID=A0AAD5WXE1_9PEZI|nr:hypothetical protein MKZ38_004611 [Zalerion maritima]